MLFNAWWSCYFTYASAYIRDHSFLLHRVLRHLVLFQMPNSASYCTPVKMENSLNGGESVNNNIKGIVHQNVLIVIIYSSSTKPVWASFSVEHKEDIWRMLVTRQLTVAIDFHRIFFFHTVKVNGYHQLFSYQHSSFVFGTWGDKGIKNNWNKKLQLLFWGEYYNK